VFLLTSLMGISFCSDKEKYRTSERPSFNLAEAPHKTIITISDSEIPAHYNLAAEMNITDDVKNNPTYPKYGSKLQPAEGTEGIALSFNEKIQVPKNRSCNNTEPFQQHLVVYSSTNVLEQTILVEEELLVALSMNSQKLLSVPATQRLSLSRKSLSYMQKTPRLEEKVIIHQVKHVDKEASAAKREMYKLVIALKEVWMKLDLDEDSFLNLSELTRFCKQIWEEPVEDGGAQQIMEVYAKEHPEKGVNFREWCILIKEEDPDLRDFVEEIYEIFVDPLSQHIMEHDLED